MAFGQLPNPDNIPRYAYTAYQRQNTNLYYLSLGLDTTCPKIEGSKISLFKETFVESNGFIYKLINDLELTVPDINKIYYIKLTGNGNLTPELTEDAGLFYPERNAFYSIDNERLLNFKYKRT